MKKIEKRQNVCVETPLPNGWMCMHVGQLVKQDRQSITLVDASWIASTGRRNLFFAGTLDNNCEIEPLPDGVQITLPVAGAIVTQWPHALLRAVR